MRRSRFGIDEPFLRRFSPRNFTDRPIKEEDLLAIFEAAGTAPSCWNEQPWRFVRGEKEAFLSILSEKNAAWAASAPVLLLVCSTSTFSHNGKPNRWHAYDSGTAMGYLILEALRRGIYAHPMAGYSAEKAVERFGLEGLETHAVLALGYTQQPHTMSPRLGIDEIVIDRRKT
ncbi:MAG: nitroreductase family protein [Campylobacterales bacterium]